MPVILPSVSTGKPKRIILDMAFEDCRLAGYEFQRAPEEVSMALRRLNALMLEWPWSGLGYVQPEYGEGSAEELSNLPDMAVNTVAQYLALRLSPPMANELSATQKATMARSLFNLQSQLATIPEMDLPRGYQPGAGNGYRRVTSIDDLSA